MITITKLTYPRMALTWTVLDTQFLGTPTAQRLFPTDSYAPAKVDTVYGYQTQQSGTYEEARGVEPALAGGDIGSLTYPWSPPPDVSEVSYSWYIPFSEYANPSILSVSTDFHNRYSLNDDDEGFSYSYPIFPQGFFTHNETSLTIKQSAEETTQTYTRDTNVEKSIIIRVSGVWEYTSFFSAYSHVFTWDETVEYLLKVYVEITTDKGQNIVKGPLREHYGSGNGGSQAFSGTNVEVLLAELDFERFVYVRAYNSVGTGKTVTLEINRITSSHFSVDLDELTFEAKYTFPFDLTGVEVDTQVDTHATDIVKTKQGYTFTVTGKLSDTFDYTAALPLFVYVDNMYCSCELNLRATAYNEDFGKKVYYYATLTAPPDGAEFEGVWEPGASLTFPPSSRFRDRLFYPYADNLRVEVPAIPARTRFLVLPLSGDLLIREKHMLWQHTGEGRVWSGDPKTGAVEASDDEGTKWNNMSLAWNGVAGAKPPYDFEELPGGGSCSIGPVNGKITFRRSHDDIHWDDPVPVCTATGAKWWSIRSHTPNGKSTLSIVVNYGTGSVRYDSEALGEPDSWHQTHL